MALPSATPNTFGSPQGPTGTLNGLFKNVYADQLLNLVPEFAIVQKLVDFVPADKEVGDFYSQMVVLASEAGFTYLGPTGAVGSLNNATAGATAMAQIRGSELNLRTQISYAALTRSMGGNVKAFTSATKFKVQDMNAAVRKRIEIASLYGQTDIGTVASSSFDGTNTSVVITDATWAGGIWAGLENALLDFWAPTGTTAAGSYQLLKVNSSTKTLVFTGNITTAATAGNVINFAGACTNKNTGAYNEMAGLQKILTVNGSIFGVDNSQYSLWQGNQYNFSGPISQAKMDLAISLAVNKGLMEKLAVLISPKAWSVLNTNQAALRMYDSSYKAERAENGAEALRFHSQNGALEVYSHPFVKDGDFFAFPPDAAMRVGSKDLTFGRPGVDGDSETYFTTVPNSNALELQAMSDQAFFLEKPAHGIYGFGISYS